VHEASEKLMFPHHRDSLVSLSQPNTSNPHHTTSEKLNTSNPHHTTPDPTIVEAPCTKLSVSGFFTIVNQSMLKNDSYKLGHN
jgi:hypothetical protein